MTDDPEVEVLTDEQVIHRLKIVTGGCIPTYYQPVTH
jgi:hypothetical protein